MSSRIERARQIRAAVRRKRGENPYKDHQVFDLGLPGTIGLILCLLFTGCAMATSFILFHSPGCMTVGVRGTTMDGVIKENTAAVVAVSASASGSTTASAASGSTTASASLTKNAPVSSTNAPVSSSNPPVSSAGASVSLSICSPDQMKSIEQQLTPTNCFEAPFTQSCSFTMATMKSGCQETTAYYRQPMATMALTHPFTAVLLGLLPQDDTPMDLLAIGSHNHDKYNMNSWRDAVGGVVCAKPGAIMIDTNIQPARLFVVEEDASMAMQAKEWKTKTGLTNDDLLGENTHITNTPKGNNQVTLTDWVQQRIPTGDIHYLRISASGSRDYQILVSGGGPGGVLDRIWYLEFVYDWKEGWEAGNLKPLIHDTLSSFVCYWHGGAGNLWRISGCWHNHYQFKTWSKVVCVNYNVEAAKPIYEKMEEAFARTLTKGLTF